MKNSFPEAIKQLDHLNDFWMPLKIKYDRTPGISIGVVYQGKLLYQKGFGFADADKKIKSTGKTLYHIASISKVFTATAIMQLVERGTLRLDDKVADHLKWFKAKAKNIDSRNITIRQLLSHASGIFRDGDTPHWSTGKFPNDLRRAFSDKSLRIENLTGFKYTNYGYALLGEIVREVSGLPYEEYIEKNILTPLHMKDTFVDYSQKVNLHSLAAGYGRVVPDIKREKFPHYKTNSYAPATGFISNPGDMANFFSALSLNEKRGVLGRESKKEMMHAYEKTTEGEEYGLGLEIMQVSGRKIVGHGGGFNGFITRVSFDPQNDLGVVVLTNSLESFAPSIARGILGFIYEYVDKRSEYAKNKKINYQTYEGIYRNAWGDLAVVRVGNTLVGFSPETNAPLGSGMVYIPEKKKYQFFMKNKHVFSATHEIVEFGNIKNGKAHKVLLGATPLLRVKGKTGAG